MLRKDINFTVAHKAKKRTLDKPALLSTLHATHHIQSQFISIINYKKDSSQMNIEYIIGN